MIDTALARKALIAAAFVLMCATSSAWPHRHRQKVHVRFLVTSTLVRGTWGMNEDTYLVELRSSAETGIILARLMDTYPNEFPPLPREVLISDSGAILTVKRDSECDRPFREILLRTAPGDPMAIYRGKLSYQPKLSAPVDPDAVLPCYRVAR